MALRLCLAMATPQRINSISCAPRPTGRHRQLWRCRPKHGVRLIQDSGTKAQPKQKVKFQDLKMKLRKSAPEWSFTVTPRAL